VTTKRARQIASSVAFSIVLTAAVFGAAEAVLRGIFAIRNARVESIALPYVIDDDYGPMPPWTDSFRVLERDPALLWRNRPSVQRRYVDIFSPVSTEDDRLALLRRFRPSLPDFVRRNPTWNVALNSEGFRSPEFELPKPRGRVRIVCLGDSWTFGANVDQHQSYPSQLQTLLRHAFPAADVEVLNLGVMGYSSFQGLELLRRRALALEPDAIVVGFAMNDGRVAGFRDQDVATGMASSPWLRAADLAARSVTVRMLRYLLLSTLHRPKSLEQHLRAANDRATDQRLVREHYVGTEAWTRVPLPDYEHNVTTMVELARNRGAGVVLLFNDLAADNPYRTELERVAAATGVPLVDSQRLIAEARRKLELDIERARGLTPEHAPRARANGDTVEVVLRVTANGEPVPRALFVAGAHPALGGLVPNRVALHDDGTHGDQRAGDGVWSYAVSLPPGTRLSYVYTNSGREGRWEGLDVPALRHLVVDAPTGRTIYEPIESFGKLYLQADAWHTDAGGYALVARAVFDTLTRNETLRARLSRPAGLRALHD